MVQRGLIWLFETRGFPLMRAALIHMPPRTNPNSEKRHYCAEDSHITFGRYVILDTLLCYCMSQFF